MAGELGGDAQVALAGWIARWLSHTRLGLEEPHLPWSQPHFICHAAILCALGSCLAALPAGAPLFSPLAVGDVGYLGRRRFLCARSCAGVAQPAKARPLCPVSCPELKRQVMDGDELRGPGWGCRAHCLAGGPGAGAVSPAEDSAQSHRQPCKGEESWGLSPGTLKTHEVALRL